jgi:hypothetical protein
VFADVATYLDARDLRRAVSHWEQQVDYPGALDDTETGRRRRRFYFNQSYQGMWSASGDLDPESGHVVATALHSHTDPANLDPADQRSLPQRNADALVDICRFWLDHNNDTAISGGERPHITVTVPYATLTGDDQRLGEIDGTAPRRSGASPATPASSASSSTVRVNPSTLGAEPAPSPQRSAERSNYETAAAPGPDAPHRRRGATPTTSSTGPTAASPPSSTSSCSAADTTPPPTTANTHPTDDQTSRLRRSVP